MKHICFYTTVDVLNHKRNSGGYMYWEIKTFPKLYREYDKLIDEGKDIDEEPRLYFAYGGMIRGYFIADNWEDNGYFHVEFDSDSWVDIKPIPTKPHQGFKYIEVA